MFFDIKHKSLTKLQIQAVLCQLQTKLAVAALRKLAAPMQEKNIVFKEAFASKRQLHLSSQTD